MNCNQVRDFILTDYMDDRLSGTVLNAVKAHLSKCPDCREFERVARQAAVEPFRGLSMAHAPDEVWQNVRERVLEQDRRWFPSWRTVFGGVWKNLFEAKSAVAWAGFCSVLIVTFVVAQHISHRKFLQAQDKEQVEYLAYLMGYSETAFSGTSGYGTDIEAVFL
ncbi:MAG TPA: zf-HC2 domain-containing protein [Candidatus Omnitrophota bacterium]|nr:zf-HC2 domain-containing protein [Candidatus Omnitrophota bacterium]HPB67538.1 zf-HC2 domain-containing protein [Candidatus Omnitrophota bacterium]HQO58200.1 zf-HC2 domain-containing protein [Candidatus Omnitrophota bacterium]HQP12189.1 zf-HC2 domain-containing protein [Candidatus Omnitrophota bacterium]